MQGQPSTDLSRLQERGWLGNWQTPKPKPWGMDAPQGRSPLCAYFHCWDRSGMLNMRHASYQVTDTSAPYHQNPQWEHWEGLHQEPQTTQEASIFPLEALPAARHCLKAGEELKCEENETLERLASPHTQGVDLPHSPTSLQPLSCSHTAQARRRSSGSLSYPAVTEGIQSCLSTGHSQQRKTVWK